MNCGQIDEKRNNFGYKNKTDQVSAKCVFIQWFLHPRQVIQEMLTFSMFFFCLQLQIRRFFGHTIFSRTFFSDFVSTWR